MRIGPTKRTICRRRVVVNSPHEDETAALPFASDRFDALLGGAGSVGVRVVEGVSYA